MFLESLNIPLSKYDANMKDITPDTMDISY